MAKVIGRTGAVGIGVESTQGTKVAAAFWVPVQSYSMDDKVEYVKNDSAIGNIAENNAADIVKLWSEGEIGGKIFLDSIGEELVALFGQSPSSAQRATSGVYDHSYTLLNSNDHKSLTVAYEDGIQELSFPFAMINTWALEVAVDDYVKRTVSFMGKKSETATHSPSFSDEIEFIPSQITFKLASAQSGLDAAGGINVTAFNFEVAKNVEALYALGSNEPEDIINKQIAITGSVELYFENETYRDYVFGNTKRAMRIDMTDANTDLGSSHNPQLYFDFNEVVFEEFERSWDSNDPLKQTLNFEALFSLADSELFAARLTNTETAY